MNSILTLILSVFVAFCSTSATAGSFGGGRASGSFSGSRGGSSFSGGRASSFSAPRSFSAPSRAAGGSFFGGSRASGSKATITRPSALAPSAPRGGYSAPRTVIHETHHYGSPGGGGNGFLTGFLFGNLFHSNPAPVVVNAQPGAATQYAPAPTVYEEHGFFYYVMRIITWLVIAGVVLALVFWAVDKLTRID